MTPNYKAKPVFVHAVRVFKVGEHELLEAIPVGAPVNRKDRRKLIGCVFARDSSGKKLSTCILVPKGSWIVTGDSPELIQVYEHSDFLAVFDKV